MLGVGLHVADQFWSLAGRVAQCCRSYAQFFLLKESQVILNFFIIIYGHCKRTLMYLHFPLTSRVAGMTDDLPTRCRPDRLIA